jgi:hypothetical protein
MDYTSFGTLTVSTEENLERHILEDQDLDPVPNVGIWIRPKSSGSNWVRVFKRSRHCLANDTDKTDDCPHLEREPCKGTESAINSIGIAPDYRFLVETVDLPALPIFTHLSVFYLSSICPPFSICRLSVPLFLSVVYLSPFYPSIYILSTNIYSSICLLSASFLPIYQSFY